MRIWTAALAWALVVCAGAAGAEARTLTIDDYATLAAISDVQIAPDGKSILFIVSRANVAEDRYDRTLMLYDLATGTQRPLSNDRQDVSSPAWSPDGARIAFLDRKRSGSQRWSQIFVMEMRGGDPRPISDAPRGVEQFAWRPDSAAIAYVAPDAPPDEAQIKQHLDGFVVGDQSYLSRAAPMRNRIWVVNADGSANRRITSGEFNLPSVEPPSSPGAPISWSPNGREIVFTMMPNDYDADSDLAVVAIVDVATGEIRRLTNHGKFEGYGAFSPDGSKVAYWYPQAGDLANQTDVFVAPSSGGTDGTDVTAAGIDTNVVRAIWMPNGSLLIAGHRGTDCALWIKPADAPARRLDLAGVQPLQFFWLDGSASATGSIAFAGSNAAHPSELYYMATPQSKPRRLTSYNDAIASLDLGKVDPVAWNFEGFNEDGVVTYPPQYDPAKKYPLLLVIHGGPQSSSSTGFSFANQVYAAHGWIVFNPNYRGSDNLGNGYYRGIFNDAGAGPGRDVMAGLAAVERTASVDTSRIAVSGWSYGGYMTSWLIGHYHLWRAAVAGAAVNDLVDEYALSDNGVQDRYGFPRSSSPWQNGMLQNYVDQSPITYAWDITTPTLILSDTGDSRVPITQSYAMFRALKDRGTTVEFWAYPVSGHFPSDPVRTMDVYRRWSAWIVKYFR